MFLLKKVIQIREKSHPDHEKPFLDHLEDLRVMVTRIAITLLISVLVCFSFQKQLMHVLRIPVEKVWIAQTEAKLPPKDNQSTMPLTVEVWEKAKNLEHAAAGLDATARELFYKNHDPALVQHSKSVAILRAALFLPQDQRKDFIDALDASTPLKDQVKALLVNEPSPEVDSRGNLRMMSALKPTETFMLSMKLSFFAGIILSFPLLLLFLLQFILPGLHANEKRVLWPAMLVGFGLFITGVFFAYFVVLPRALAFFYEWSGSLGVSNDWRIGEYISFATQFTLLFGLSFELPVVVMVLVKLGIMSYETMSKTRSYAVLGIFVAAAVLTPTPDALTLALMALPMLILYELCIWLAWLDRRKNRVVEETEAREREEGLLATGSINSLDEFEHDARTSPTNRNASGEISDATRKNGDDGWCDEYPELQDHDPYVNDLTDNQPLQQPAEDLPIPKEDA